MFAELYSHIGLTAVVALPLAHALKWIIPRLEKLLNVESHYSELSSEFALGFVSSIVAYGLLWQKLVPREFCFYSNSNMITAYAVTLMTVLISLRVVRCYIRRPKLSKETGGHILSLVLNIWDFFQRNEKGTDNAQCPSQYID